MVTTLHTPWHMADAIGYEPKTTFWDDFSIADAFGVKGIEDTFNRAFKEWKGNYVYLTELVLVLNHKLWHHYDRHNYDEAECYNRLWKKADEHAANNLKGEELQYFYKTTD